MTGTPPVTDRHPLLTTYVTSEHETEVRSFHERDHIVEGCDKIILRCNQTMTDRSNTIGSLLMMPTQNKEAS